MITPRLSIIRQIAFGYLVLIVFSLGAVSYSLHSLSSQNQGANRLINVDIRSQNLARQLRSALRSQERLERQAIILKQQDLTRLFQERNEEIAGVWSQLLPLLERHHAGIPSLRSTFDQFEQTTGHLNRLLAERDWTGADDISRNSLEPLRQELYKHLDTLLVTSSALIDQTLNQLTDESDRAYQVVVVLIILGLLLATLVAISTAASIRRSMMGFADALRAIGTGAFDLELETSGLDEFSSVAREFRDMGRKLRELEQLRLDANPLTRLPGNLVIERDIEARIQGGEPFAHGFADLDHFKAYNDRYGYGKGSKVIALTGEIIREAVQQHGTPGDFIGHIGGDDYIFLTQPDHAETICEQIIERFDREIPAFYTDEDRQRGHFQARDRYGVERQFPLLSISIAVVCTDRFDHPSGVSLGRECAKMKEHLKKLPGSRYLIDRRRGD